MKKLAVERWKSSQNRNEVHFFIKGNQKQYVLGFDPSRFEEKEILALLKKKGYIYDN
jgi:hypothetical protein